MTATPSKVVWVCFLHLYQPANQAKDIFQRVVSESYRPLVNHLLENPTIKITLNISGALTEQLIEHKCQDVIDGFRQASERGQIEFTDSAKFHALLPFLSDQEIKRQITLNRETNAKYFGHSYKPQGFFPPEMGYSTRLAPILDEMGYQWVILDEIALNGKVEQLDSHTTYKIKNTNLYAFFRERVPSNLIMSALIRQVSDFEGIRDFYQKGYFITGMDGETFGHHRPGLDTLLTGLLLSPKMEHAFLSDLPNLFPKVEEVTPVDSTWASTEKDIETGVQFLTWKDPQNEIHTWLWELQNLALQTVAERPQSTDSRQKLDAALASDHFFWASARPWWSIEMIETGAWQLLDVIENVPSVENQKERARYLYQKIIAKAFEWQRSGRIKEIYADYRETPRVPFKDRTVGSGEPWVYDAFIQFMRQEMKKAAEKENFEEATLWRDAIWKLETKNDIYDAVHAVDLLRKRLDEGEIYQMIDKYRQEYEKVASGQPESRGN